MQEELPMINIHCHWTLFWQYIQHIYAVLEIWRAYYTRSCTRARNYRHDQAKSTYLWQWRSLKPQCHILCAWEEQEWQCPVNSTAGDGHSRSWPPRWTRLQDSCASTRTQRRALPGLVCSGGCGKDRWRAPGLSSSRSRIWSATRSGQCLAGYWTASDWTLEPPRTPCLLPHTVVQNQKTMPCSWPHGLKKLLQVFLLETPKVVFIVQIPAR